MSLPVATRHSRLGRAGGSADPGLRLPRGDAVSRQVGPQDAELLFELGELNKDARTKMLEEAQTRFIDEWMPMYVLYAQPVKTMVQGNVGGYDY